MIFSKFIARQLGHPSGVFGTLAAALWNKRNAALNDAAFDSLALRPDDRVLEVGFGGGYLLGRMSSIVTTGFLAGVDVSPAMAALCEKRYRPLVQAGKLDIKCARAEFLPYPSGHFTKVCTVNSIFYWQDVSQALSEFCRVLVNSGALVMCFTLKTSLENRSFAKHVGLFEADEVQHMMKSSGFKEINVQRLSDRHREFVCLIGEKRNS